MTSNSRRESATVLAFPGPRPERRAQPELEAALAALGLDPAAVGAVDPGLVPALLRLPRLWRQAYAGETLSARRTDLRRYVAWAASAGLAPLCDAGALGERICDHLAELSEAAGAATIRRATATLGSFLAGLGLDRAPAAEQGRLALRARNRAARARDAVAKPEMRRLSLDEIEAIETAIAAAPVSALRKVRDRAILRLMSWLMLRRSELCELRLSDWNGADRTMLIAHGKTDQAGRGVVYDVDEATAAAIEAWLELSGLGAFEGRDVLRATPLFMGVRKEGALRFGKDGELHPLDGGSVARLLQEHAKRAGIEGVSGHTPRRSMARILCESGRSDEEVMQAGRWRKAETMRDYAGLPSRRPSASHLLAAGPG